MSDSIPLSEDDRADLVAYLDGELKGEAARALEKRLARDRVFRAEADALKQAWDMLDFLPRPEPSPNFTHRTLERLEPVQVDRPGGPSLWRRWRKPLLGAGWAAALVLAVFAGYGAYSLIVPRFPGEADLIRDLRLIENKRLYDLADSLEFLKQLDKPDLFGEESPGS
jgi:anti-sigma factor RsiW